MPLIFIAFFETAMKSNGFLMATKTHLLAIKRNKEIGFQVNILLIARRGS